MGATVIDLAKNYRGLRNRSRTIRAIEEQARQKGITYPELGSDLFNLLYQKNPQLRGDLDPNSAYTHVLRSVANSPSFKQIRLRTQRDTNWAALGASILLDEIASKLQMQDQPPPIPPQPPSDEECDNPTPSNRPGDEKNEDKPAPNEESEEESEGGDSESEESEENESESEEDSERQNKEGNSSSDSEDENEDGMEDDEDSENESGGDPSENENENEEESEENGGTDSDSGDNPDGEPDDSDSDSDNRDESDDSESDDGDSDSEGDESESDEEDSESNEGTGESPIGELEEDNEPQVDPNEGDINKAIQNAIDDAAKKIDDALGGLAAGKGDVQMGEADQLQVMEAYAQIATNPYLQKVVQNIGRLKLDQRFFAAVRIGDPEETIGITRGNNLKATLPRDLALFALPNKGMKRAFIQKYDQKQLMNKQYKNVAHPGKGPMVVCLDRSSSMQGRRTNWAVTLCVALYFQAVKEQRPFALVQFGSGAYVHEPNQQRILDPKFLEWMTADNDMGGTSFDRAFVKATQFMYKHSQKSVWSNADIVFITDGEDHIDPDHWNKEKERLNFRLFTFVIGMSEAQSNEILRYDESRAYEPVYRYREIQQMKKTADGMLYIENLDSADEHTAFQMVRSDAQKRGRVK